MKLKKVTFRAYLKLKDAYELYWYHLVWEDELESWENKMRDKYNNDKFSKASGVEFSILKIEDYNLDYNI